MNVVFLPTAWEQYLYWATNDRKLLARLNALIQDVRRSPFGGLGKPEPLRDSLAGWWSRRIDGEHRLVYRVKGKGGDQVLEILQCRYHYQADASRWVTLEGAIAYVQGGELVEVTPKVVRIRKKYLDPHERKRQSRRSEAA